MRLAVAILAFTLAAIAKPVPAPAPTPAPVEVVRAEVPMCPQTICVKRREMMAHRVNDWDAAPTGTGEVERDVGVARGDIDWGVYPGEAGSVGKRDNESSSVPDWDNRVVVKKRQVVTPTCHC
ncbi:hypothetical protein BKA62DRAFT_718747 [Auriculariales sp. MPI-PUGE-AT-0066]|nr:hypothetical protein BKA62DRAFT_718747 [Auriculariales sp. MPI-PUGE-AT-0066]